MTLELESAPLIGIALAVGSAAALAVGNLLQARGVRAIEADAAQGEDGSKAVNLLRNHFWLIGTLLLGITVLLQMGSLTFAPLMVVQPVGVVALVFTALLTALFTKRAPSHQVVRAIAICVLGVAGFVTVAAMVSTQHAITDVQLVAVLIVLSTLLVMTAVVWFLGRSRRTPPVIWVLLGGVYSAFVATLGKTVILRVQSALHSGGLKWDVANLLTIGCILGIAVAGGLSVYFVQRAHAFNRPEVVVAGLTVVDPAVAVVLGIAILGEASGAAPWAFLTLSAAGAVAIGGVFALSRAESRTE
ncbi:multidrug DMT transporter permease [Microbacterium aurugineum]|uniref:multidrug DMT transporter permease n=1 Tax=Microbacterium aurugineum TaxID=2851642 RepID=UPI0020BE0617|nr:multidrug DMT transporter permease [Microbacterium aurugineum]MCK8478331.1 multidrug DMT transporter permease [Microbacterium aurugineum]